MGQSISDLFRRPTHTDYSPSSEYGDDDQNITISTDDGACCKYHDIIEQMAFDPVFLDPLSKFKRRIAYANSYSTDIAVTTETAAFLTNEEEDDDDDVDGNDNDATNNNDDQSSYFSALWNWSSDNNNDNVDENKSQDSAVDHLSQLPLLGKEEEEDKNNDNKSEQSSHFFVSGIRLEGNKTLDECGYKCNQDEEKIEDDDILTEYSSVRFDTPRTTTRRYSFVSETPSLPSPTSASDIAKNLNSLGWTKHFVDTRRHIPSIWTQLNNTRQSWDSRDKISDDSSNNNRTNQKKLSWYTSGELKKELCGNGWDWNTLPIGHFFLIASTKDQICERLYKSAQPFVDEVIAKEVINEMLDFASES
jgi:hypothetical protein